MKRVFWAIMEGRTDGDWSLNGLPNAGRMDEAARIVNAALWLSHDVRRDVTVYITFYGPPDPPRTVKFVGSEMRRVYPDERSIGSVIRKALRTGRTGGWTEAHPGVYVRDVGVELQEEIPLPKILLDEEGKRERIRENACFIVGGPYGVPAAARELLKPDRVVRIGNKTYTASHTICAVNFILDGGCDGT
ncbi:MAG TPA: tRNA (pseudouridine(54)-N(1))-methyltransferase TrmY [Euryarchaeota archaeon]|nr:tRNA (pseudouridine(54)-N(1))-methyltransferase TrmY [Euryarchaeota archaeon]